MTATTTAIESGRVSAHAPVRNRASHAGSPARGSATHAACASVRTKLSSENHTRAEMMIERAHELVHHVRIARAGLHEDGHVLALPRRERLRVPVLGFVGHR